MLQAGALRRSSWKKVLCRRLFQDRVLAAAACLHAKSGPERDALRRLGLRNPIAVISNPVTLPAAEVSPGALQAWRTEHAVPADQRLAVYLGRLHPVKGVPRLIEAWLAVRAEHPEWTLLLAGPDELGLQAQLEARLASAGAAGSARFLGSVEGAAKTLLLRSASLFVMPSDYENFGSAIVEALFCGVPVITTTGTPWSIFREQHLGWWVEPTVGALQQALQEAMGSRPADLAALGERARQVAAPFTTERVADDLLRLYAWLLGQSERPEFVQEV
jgi:glycosyltransferase involved in cell wall biosynthesis